MDTPDTLYRIVPAGDWNAALDAGVFTGSDLDRRDGLIHLSTAGQIAGTLAAHFAGVQGLALLTIASGRLPMGALRWEPSRDGALFPHLYADLPCRAVFAVNLLPLDGQGTHILPPGIAAPSE